MKLFHKHNSDRSITLTARQIQRKSFAGLLLLALLLPISVPIPAFAASRFNSRDSVNSFNLSGYLTSSISKLKGFGNIVSDEITKASENIGKAIDHTEPKVNEPASEVVHENSHAVSAKPRSPRSAAAPSLLNQLPEDEQETIYNSENNIGSPPGQFELDSPSAPAPLPIKHRPGAANYSFGLPLASMPGRGLDAGIGLTYNSRTWNKSSAYDPSTQTYTDHYTYDVDESWIAPGFNASLGQILSRQNVRNVTNSSQQNKTLTEIIPEGIIDPDGTRHQIKCTDYDTIIGYFGSYCVKYETTDGSLIKITRQSTSGLNGNYRIGTSVDNTLYPTIMFTAYYPNGMQKNFTTPFGSSSNRKHYPYLVEDSNGNRIRVNYRTDESGSISQIFDTLNREIKFYYEPGTGGAREKLITVAIPGMGTNDEIQTARFYYEDLTLTTTGKFDGQITAPATARVLKWVYFPSTKTAYKYYYHSNYGMITKIERRVGVTVSDPTSTTVTGTVTSEGIVAASTEYTYPDGSTILDDVPNYTKRIDDWAGRTGTSAPETLYETGTIVPTGEKTSSVTVNDGSSVIEYRTTFYNTPSWKVGLTKTMEMLSGTTVLAKTEYFWTAGPLQYGRTNPQLTKIETTNEADMTKATEFEYDGYNNQTKIKEYDYSASSSLGDLLKTTEIGYETGSGWITQRLYSLPKSIKTIVDAVTVNKTLLEYDKNGDDSSITKYTDMDTSTHNRNFNPGNPAWDDEFCPIEDPEIPNALPDGCMIIHHPGYTQANAYRGNLTKITRFSDATLTTDTNADVTEYSYDMTGNTVSATLSCCNLKTIDYGSSWNVTGYAYPVSETKGTGSTQLQSLAAYNFNTGLATSTTDPNGQATTYQYESDTLRPKKTIFPNSAYAETEYSDKLVSNPSDLMPGFVRTTTTLESNKFSQSYSYYDGKGQGIRGATQVPGGWNVSAVEFDNMGRARKMYNPFSVSTPTAAIPSGTKFSEITEIDALGRTTEVTLQDTTTVTTAYGHGTDTNYVTATDQAGKQRRQVADSLGRIVRVDEPDASGSLGTITSPNQPTSYEYDGNDNLVKVIQFDGTTTQERKFLYDSLSRLVAERQVEADPTLALDGTKGTSDPSKWTKVLKYDADGLLYQGIDARGVTTEFAYDDFNRVEEISSSDGTPKIKYYYDQARTGFFNKGALTRVETVRETTTPAEIFETSAEFDYDLMGRIVKHRQWLGQEEYDLEYGYNLAGQLVSEKYPSGKIVTTSYDDNGRLENVSDAQRTYLNGVTYSGVGGAVSAMAFGNGTTESYTMNNRMQMTGQELKKGSAIIQKYVYGYGEVDTSGGLVESKNNGQLGKIESYIGSSKQWTQKFQYDSIGRLKQAAEFKGDDSSLTYRQNFDFDRFGNMYRKAASNPTTGQANPLPYTPIENSDISKETNRFATDTTYDEAGNVVTDSKFRDMSFDYDANGRMLKASRSRTPDAWTVYDVSGNRVATKVNDVWQCMIYDAFGKLIAEYGGPETSAPGGVQYVQQDWQGSVRTITNNAGFVLSRTDHTSFGEKIGSGVGLRTSSQGFGIETSTKNGYGLTEKDAATGLDHTWFRKNENQAGRWTGPDPYLGSMKIGNPQSFNRYSYVQNQPTDFVDPTGLMIAVPNCERVCVRVQNEDGTWGESDCETVCHGYTYIDIGGGGFDSGFENYPGNFDPNFGGGVGGGSNSSANPTSHKPKQSFSDCKKEKERECEANGRAFFNDNLYITLLIGTGVSFGTSSGWAGLSGLGWKQALRVGVKSVVSKANPYIGVVSSALAVRSLAQAGVAIENECKSHIASECAKECAK